MANHNKEHEDPEPDPLENGVVRIGLTSEERKEAERVRQEKDEREYKNSQTRIQKGLYRTQKILVIFGMVGLIANWYQYRIARNSAEQARRAADLASDSFNAAYGEHGISDRTMQQMADQTAAQFQAAQAAKSAADIANDTLLVSQGAHVSIGRSDGTIADFIVPQDANSNAGIVIYFQNTGHSPARFNWGLDYPIITIPPSPDLPQLVSPHAFRPMERNRQIKDGGIETSGGQNIPGDSLYKSDLVEMPRDRAILQQSARALFMINGIYEYCDAFGHYTCRQFQMGYQGGPFQRFEIYSDDACTIPYQKLTKPPVGYTKLPLCEPLNLTEGSSKKN